MDFFEQYQRNVSAGADFASDADLPAAPPSACPVRYLAFYLPQFHRVAENDEWWGAGFTEWTNVTKAVPRFEGHLQPRLPGTLGFYDLAEADVLRRQAALAKRGGIAGFCIHDYWFSGRKILEKPVNLLLANPDIDLPFCLSWANENWSRRWDGREDQLLLEQRYDPDDLDGYVKSIVPALSDKRYIRVGKRPLILIYRPALIPDPQRTFAAWREFLIGQGFGNPYLAMVQSFDDVDPRSYGLDAAVGFPPHVSNLWATNDRDHHNLYDVGFVGHVRTYPYLAEEMLRRFSTEFVTFPGVCPGWDNEARKPRYGTSFSGATPERYRSWLARASGQVLSSNAEDERIVFINAWNEWAEGAILEPDRHFGHAFLTQTRDVLDELPVSEIKDASFSPTEMTVRSTSIRMRNGLRRRMKGMRRQSLGRL